MNTTLEIRSSSSLVNCPRPSFAAMIAYFISLGTTGFGGPIALAARMEMDLVQLRQWITANEYSDGLAFAQLAPGPLAAQLAMYLGHVLFGFRGASAVGIAFIAPSFLIVIGGAAFYVAYGATGTVQSMFSVIGPAVIAIIALASSRLSRRLLSKNLLLWAIFCVLATSTVITGKENIFLFLGSGVLVVAIRGRFKHSKLSVNRLFPFMAMITDKDSITHLFLFFSKAGLFVFGSGLAIVPFLYAGVVQEHRWLTEQQFVDAVAVGMMTPGPVVITVAFIGYLVAGLKGAVAAAIGVFLPVYIMVTIFAPLYRRVAEKRLVNEFVSGVTAAAMGALVGAVVLLGSQSIRTIPSLIICSIALGLLLKYKVPEPVLITCAALWGIAQSAIPL